MGTHCLLPRRGYDFGGKQAYFLTEVILTVSGDLRTDAVLGGGGSLHNPLPLLSLLET